MENARWEELLLYRNGTGGRRNLAKSCARVESAIGELGGLELLWAWQQVQRGRCGKKGTGRKEGPLNSFFEQQSAWCGAAANPLK